jgi:hypothetical protein
MQLRCSYYDIMDDEDNLKDKPKESHSSGNARFSVVDVKTTRTYAPLTESLLLEMQKRSPGSGDIRPPVASETTRTTVEIDVEDIIAICSGSVAILFGVGMLAGWLPVNALTISVVTCSAVTPLIAKIVQSRKPRTTRK